MQYRNMRMPTGNGSLSVLGAGTVEVPADLAILSAGITTESKSIEEAKDKNEMIFKDVMRSLIDYGISQDDINTEDISVTRNYDYNTNTFQSYKISHVISVKTSDFAKLNDLYSLVIENGANDNISIIFTLSNPNTYYNKALKKASQDAISKAAILAKNFGVKYNNVPCKVTENSSSLYSITYTTPANYAYSTSITPGLVKVTAEVNAVFSTYIYQ